MHIAASNPLALNSDELQKELIEKEQELIAEELKNSGKNDETKKLVLVRLISLKRKTV